MHQLLRTWIHRSAGKSSVSPIIVFVFRAMPPIGAGASWWQIDVLGFDEAFFGTLRQVASILAILGMFALRGWMSRRPIPYLVVFLSLYSTVMTLPFVGMFYGLHEWTEATSGSAPAPSPSSTPWPIRPSGRWPWCPCWPGSPGRRPQNQKATYFAVMAAFTNLALSASSLGTNYLNRLFIVERGSYGELGPLMITAEPDRPRLPVVTVLIVNRWSRPRSAAATS